MLKFSNRSLETAHASGAPRQPRISCIYYSWIMPLLPYFHISVYSHVSGQSRPSSRQGNKMIGKTGCNVYWWRYSEISSWIRLFLERARCSSREISCRDVTCRDVYTKWRVLIIPLSVIIPAADLTWLGRSSSRQSMRCMRGIWGRLEGWLSQTIFLKAPSLYYSRCSHAILGV